MRYVCLAVLVLFAGCFPSTRVTRNPGPHDRGIRYYRPKPYLLVTPHVDKDQSSPTDRFVDLKLEMLPDFSEEYSIHIRSGLGTNDTSIKLDGGWNLVSVDVDIDSQFSENVNAVANAIGKFAPSQGRGVDSQDLGRATVRATNVPIGYYESVISCGPDGVKRLYGWRYIGFSPYLSCPQESCGVDCMDCHASELYGLVFEKGVMTFKPLSQSMGADHRRLVPDSTGLDRAIERLGSEVSRMVPKILDDAKISGVSDRDVRVTVDRAQQVIDVEATLNEEQMAAYRDSSHNEFDISESLSGALYQATGEDLWVRFRVRDGR